uniref:Uncharacterized protein n=1 Tax=Timema bartmani TaxID=61472 RepID=A0A7R9F602_9NEOP|nr:unnamed protein product [Timema bartmani]
MGDAWLSNLMVLASKKDLLESIPNEEIIDAVSLSSSQIDCERQGGTPNSPGCPDDGLPSSTQPVRDEQFFPGEMTVATSVQDNKITRGQFNGMVRIAGPVHLPCQVNKIHPSVQSIPDVPGGFERRNRIADLHTMTNCRQLQEIYQDRNKKFYDQTETHENELVRGLEQYDPTEPRHHKRPRLA